MLDRFVYKVTVKGTDDLPDEDHWVSGHCDLDDIRQMFGDDIINVIKFQLGNGIQLKLDTTTTTDTLVDGDEASGD